MTTEGQGRLDSSSVEQLYRDHGVTLRRFLVGLLRDGHLVDEALQRTFCQAVTAAGNVAVASLRAWLFRVAYHEAMAIRRRQSLDARSLRGLADSLPRYGLSVEEDLVRREDISRVRQVIETLPVDQQLVVRKRTYEQKTFAEIAEELQIPLGTVLTRMRLALQKLRIALDESDR